MQTHLHIAVSQYAKTHLPTAKSPATNSFTVSQQPKNLLHTPTHTGSNEPIEPKKINDFIALVQNLYPQFIVSFTAHSYLENHFTNCKKEHIDLFLNLVKAFALMHHSNRRTTVENVLVALDSDYIEAFKLWQQCQPQQKFIATTTLQKVLQLLQYRYENKNFSAQQIAVQLNYNTDYINSILQQLIQLQKITLVATEQKTRQRIFQLLKK
jgi:ribosome-associated toxin RatA of RatAB toxin-antitoxin module